MQAAVAMHDWRSSDWYYYKSNPSPTVGGTHFTCNRDIVDEMSTSSPTTSECPVSPSLPSVAEDAELLPPVSSPSIRSISLPSELSPAGSLHGPCNGLNIDQGYQKKRVTVRVQGKHPRHETTISMLSDDVLLEIFDFCKKNHDPGPRYKLLPEAVWDWQILVHVCQRWRQVVSASPLRLDLRILCTYGTPVRKYLDVWPTIPINIEYYIKTVKGIDEDNLIVALGHTDRVSSIYFGQGERTGARLLRKMVTVMQEPFPALTHILLSVLPSKDVPVLPSEFLGRSAPCLQKIELFGIPFPALPVLLLSTSHLVELQLYDIPQTGYIPPEAMAAALTLLTMLENLAIGFQSPASRPDQIRLPPITRNVLPALTSFDFTGVREYLEDFVERINAPRLHKISTRYFNQLFDFEIPQLWRFIDHSEDLNQPRCCLVTFQYDIVSFSAGPTTDWHIPEPESVGDIGRQIDVKILCDGIDWQVSHLAQAFNQTSAVLSNILHLAIDAYRIIPDTEDLDDIEWLQLLRPFSSVQTLFVSEEIAGHVSRSLENTAATMANEVLLALDMLCLEGQPMTFAHKFVAARWESGHPVTTVDTKRAFQERLKSYS